MAMALLIGRNETEQKRYDWFIRQWREVLLSLDADLDIRIWPDIKNPADIEIVLDWRHPLGVLNQFSNLKCIASLGAGVDHILEDDALPDVPIARIVDPNMAKDITQYVVVNVLYYVKRIAHWHDLQAQKLWEKIPPFHFNDKTIGIMGLGFLGAQAAQALSYLGLTVHGWSVSPKNIPGIKSFVGKGELDSFLSNTDILVCLLPLTPETRNILNTETFNKLRSGAYLINLGRGEHLVEPDLISSLDSGQLVGACLDVFRQEPLPEGHLFWSHPKIRITPHIASVTDPTTAALQILDNYRRIKAGKPLMNLINKAKGY